MALARTRAMACEMALVAVVHEAASWVRAAGGLAERAVSAGFGLVWLLLGVLVLSDVSRCEMRRRNRLQLSSLPRDVELEDEHGGVCRRVRPARVRRRVRPSRVRSDCQPPSQPRPP